MLNREPIALAVTGGSSDFVVDTGGRRIAIETEWSSGDPLLHARVDRQAVVVQVDAMGAGLAADA